MEDGDIPEIKADLVAQADLITQVRARTDRASATGLLRISSMAAGESAQTRIGLRAEASATDTSHSAAIYLEARSDGTSHATVQADRFAIVTGSAANATRRVPFIVRGGEVRITELFVDRLAVADRAVSVWEYAQTAGGINSSALDDVVIQTLTLAKGRGEPLPIFYSAVRDVGGTDYVYLHLYRGATRLNSVRMGAGQSGDVHTYIDTWTGSGAVTYTLRASVMRVGDPADIRLGGSPITQRFLGAFNVYK